MVSVRSIAAVVVGIIVVGPASVIGSVVTSVIRPVVVLFRGLVNGFDGSRGGRLLGSLHGTTISAVVTLSVVAFAFVLGDFLVFDRTAVAVDADVRAGRVVAVAVTGGCPAVVMSRIVTVAMTPSGIAPVAVVTGGRLLVGDGGHGLLFRLVFGGHQGQHGQDNLKRNGGMSQYSIPEMVVEPFGLTAALRANFILEWNVLVEAKAATDTWSLFHSLFIKDPKRGNTLLIVKPWTLFSGILQGHD